MTPSAETVTPAQLREGDRVTITLHGAVRFTPSDQVCFHFDGFREPKSWAALPRPVLEAATITRQPPEWKAGDETQHGPIWLIEGGHAREDGYAWMKSVNEGLAHRYPLSALRRPS